MSDQQMPPIILWPDSGKGNAGPNELQKKYYIDRIPPELRPHLHTQDVLLSIGGVGSGKSVGAVTRMIDQARLWPGIQIYLGAFNMKILARNIWQPFESILLEGRDRKKRHPFLTKSFGENSQYAKFANGATITCINLKENIKENIGFTAGLIVIDEVHLLPDEEALKLIIGRCRGVPPEIRQIILCTNPELSKQGWMNQAFNLSMFDGVDTTSGPVEKLTGAPCRCQFCTTCRATFKKDVMWVKDGDNYKCPNCHKTKDFYTWEGKKYWCPGDQQYWRVIKSESHHNQHLPDDYYQGMEDMYDPTFFDIMVRGKTNVDLREDYVYNKFNQERQVLDEPIPLDWSRDVFWGLDFNLQPECSVICQYDAVSDHKAFVAKEELTLFGPTEDNPYGKANAVDVANAFVARYKQDYQGHMVYIFCDPHGWGGQTSRELTRPAQIIRILEANGFFCQLVTDSSPFPLKERIDTMNQVCSDGTLYINPVRGKRGDPAHLILSFAELKWKDKVEKDTLDTSGDSNAKRATRRDRVYCMTHPTDALSYIIYHQFNILQEFAETPSVTVVGKVTIEQESTGEVKKEFFEAPETTKEHIKDGNIPRESEVSRHNRELAAQVQADKERINNRSLKGLLSDRGMKLW